MLICFSKDVIKIIGNFYYTKLYLTKQYVCVNNNVQHILERTCREVQIVIIDFIIKNHLGEEITDIFSF